ncbi:MAG: TIGR03936 family radical SAM-associated protein, partial [Deltaproteobacteria bacterium]|nr:TIGR03936 family radical SAM-associated protein [Deltaproteobacteria bacterium]
YVPALHQEGDSIRKRIISDLNLWCLPTRPVVPLMKTIHDRITLEIARGCTRGCRFCQAGMVWRPVREREQAGIEKMAEGLLCATGYDELSLLSLSSGDYSRIEPLLAALMERYYEKRVALALPSLRAETLTKSLIENIRRVRKTSFTLAPEAGTQRLRNIINKGNSSEELLATTEQIFAAGWKSIKLYFMLGLPEETPADLEGIVELAYQTLKTGQQRGNVTVSLSTFVPKAHTPFQWQRQISMAETRERQFFLKDRIRHRNISVKWHDAKTSMLEGILSRGDTRTGDLIAAAFRLGCRFDGWTDLLRFDLWEQAMAQTGVGVSPYLEARDPNGKLPWDRIDCGVDRDFLLQEANRALAGVATPDCRNGLCQDCGVCDQETIQIITAATPVPITKPAHPEPCGVAQDMLVEGQPFMVRQAHHERLSVPPILLPAPTMAAGETGKLFRIKFTKQQAARFLSHAELAEALIRAIKRQGLTFVYSQGFHPHPRISFAFATAVGMESRAEYADIQVAACAQEPRELQEEINALLPAGLEIIEIREMKHPAGSLAALMKGFSYAIALPQPLLPEDNSLGLAGLREKIDAFLQSPTVIITRETKEKKVAKDIRPFVSDLVIDAENRTLTLTVHISAAGTVRPLEILTHVLKLSPEAALQARIVKTETHWVRQ